MISIIAAIGKNNELGKNNSLIWRIPFDMKFFKETTTNHKVVMGRKTFESIPSGLPGREIIVVSTKTVDRNVLVEPTINRIVDKYKNSAEEIFICGGASIYKEFFPYAKRLYLTEIDEIDKEADTFFPKFDKKVWKKKVLYKDRYKDIDYKICLYERKII